MIIPNQVAFVDRHTILFERQLEADIDRVWTAVSRESELAHWFMPTKIELKENGKFSFEGGWDGWVSNLNPPYHLQFNVTAVSYTRFELALTGTGTHFSLIDRLPPHELAPQPHDNVLATNQPGGPSTHWTGVVAGWHCFVNSLESYLNGGPDPTDYDKMCEEYDSFLRNYYASKEE
ncbi:MAG: SRPBCC domain-containing protein [Chloroflexota bacterium]